MNKLSVQGPFLPGLEFVSGDPILLASLVIGWPVSHVEIPVGVCLSGEREVLGHLVQALAQTSVPLMSVARVLRTIRIHLSGPKFLQQLKTTWVQSTLRSLSVSFPRVMWSVLLASVSRPFTSPWFGFHHLQQPSETRYCSPISAVCRPVTRL
jgi:hypothetical protein